MPALINALAFATGIRLKNPVSQAAASGADAGVDLGPAGTQYEGNILFVQHVGAVTGSIAGKIQSSTDDAATDPYADVSGGGFTTVSAANNLQLIAIDARNLERWVRYAYTVVTGPALVGVTAFALKKNR